MGPKPTPWNYLRPALCGVFALIVHVAVAMALPEKAPFRAEAEVSMEAVWLDTGLSPAQPGAESAHERDASPVAPPAVTRARATRSALRVRAAALPATVDAPRSDDANVPAPAAQRAAAAIPAAALAPISAEATNDAAAGQARTRVSGSGSAQANGGGGQAVSAHGPGLIAFGSPCAGYFPPRAHADHGEVQITVDVDAHGHARASTVVIEQPLGQGFGSAARDCARQLHFAPAITDGGAAVPGHAKLRLRFDRRSAS